MTAGAPRTVTPPPDEVIKLGIEMLEWVEKEKPLHLSFWWRAEKGMRPNEWKALILVKEFLVYYDKSLSLISKNYLNGNIAPPLAQRFLRRYFDDVREQEDEDLRSELELEKEKIAYEVKLKSDAAVIATEDQLKVHYSILDQMRDRQASHAERKIEESNKIKDA